MGRIITAVTITNVLEPSKEIRCDGMVDTGAFGLTLPSTWKPRLGSLPLSRKVELATADHRPLVGEVCGPVTIQIAGFPEVSGEVVFIDMPEADDTYEPLIGYMVLEASQAAVDMVGHRLTQVRYLDLKGGSPSRSGERDYNK